MDHLIARQIEEYFSNPENLNRLRQQILNLEDYLLKGDIEIAFQQIKTDHQNEIDQMRSDHQNQIDQMQREIERIQHDHRVQIDRMEIEHQNDLQRIQHDHRDQIYQMRQEFDQYKSSVEIQLQKFTDISKELSQWKSKYGLFSKAYENFMFLSDKNRNSIAGIFGGCDNPIDFFCGALQKGHLDQLWDYIGDELKSNDTNDEENDRLVALFDFAFDAVNRSQREPLFNRLNPQIGSRFDSETMGRDNESPQNGNVSQLIFAGYSHAVTGEIVKRSLVRLEGLN